MNRLIIRPCDAKFHCSEFGLQELHLLLSNNSFSPLLAHQMMQYVVSSAITNVVGRVHAWVN